MSFTNQRGWYAPIDNRVRAKSRQRSPCSLKGGVTGITGEIQIPLVRLQYKSAPQGFHLFQYTAPEPVLLPRFFTPAAGTGLGGKIW
jgi:hypothetical protein